MPGNSPASARVVKGLARSPTRVAQIARPAAAVQIPLMPKPIALVTGATEGIGRAIAMALGAEGYAVAVTARTGPKVAALVGELTSGGITAVGIRADVADSTSVAQLVDSVTRELGPVGVLVNNAGIAIAKPFLETSLEEWDQTFATNVRSLYLVTRATLPGMIAAGQGDIINIASLAGKNGIANAAAYCASKHAVLGFSRSLMLEVRKQGVRVIAICPGSVDTPLLRASPAFSPNWDRILKPEDVAALVVDALRLSRRATISELEIRPSNP